MPRYFAFLRAINVGGHRLKMERLRELIEELGFEQVETFIASGNVVFSSTSMDARGMEARIADHLHEALGYEVPTFIRSQPELEAVAAFQPSEPVPADLSAYVIFLSEEADTECRQNLEALGTDADRFEFAGREVHRLIDGKLSDSPLFGVDLTKAVGGGPMTARNITTVRKLVAKYGAPD
jgi:uncharacterized protein (DUF1697 family)